MLHVKKDPQTRTIIHFKPLFLPKWELLFGLTIATCLHVIFFISFNIVTLPREYRLALKPIDVEVEIHSLKPYKTPSISSVTPTPSHHYSSSQKTSLPSLTTFKELEQEPDFSAIEEFDYESFNIDFDDDCD